MIEIYPNLFVGDQGDYEYQVKGQDGWAVVHACKEPYHRQLLGYRTRGAPKGHPEYLYAGAPKTMGRPLGAIEVIDEKSSDNASPACDPDSLCLRGAPSRGAFRLPGPAHGYRR